MARKKESIDWKTALVPYSTPQLQLWIRQIDGEQQFAESGKRLPREVREIVVLARSSSATLDALGQYVGRTREGQDFIRFQELRAGYPDSVNVAAGLLASWTDSHRSPEAFNALLAAFGKQLGVRGQEGLFEAKWRNLNEDIVKGEVANVPGSLRQFRSQLNGVRRSLNPVLEGRIDELVNLSRGLEGRDRKARRPSVETRTVVPAASAASATQEQPKPQRPARAGRARASETTQDGPLEIQLTIAKNVLRIDGVTSLRFVPTPSSLDRLRSATTPRVSATDDDVRITVAIPYEVIINRTESMLHLAHASEQTIVTTLSQLGSLLENESRIDLHVKLGKEEVRILAPTYRHEMRGGKAHLVSELTIGARGLSALKKGAVSELRDALVASLPPICVSTQVGSLSPKLESLS